MFQDIIAVYPDNCRGCRRCEMACAWLGQSAANPRMAAIRVWKIEDSGKDYPVLGQQCLDTFCGKELPGQAGSKVPACVASCLFGALKINREATE